MMKIYQLYTLKILKKVKIKNTHVY